MPFSINSKSQNIEVSFELEREELYTEYTVKGVLSRKSFLR